MAHGNLNPLCFPGHITVLICSHVGFPLLDWQPLLGREQHVVVASQGLHLGGRYWINIFMWNTKTTAFCGVSWKTGWSYSYHFNLGPLSNTFLWVRKDCVEEVSLLHQSSWWLSQFQDTLLGCFWAGLSSLCPMSSHQLPCALRGCGLRATDELHQPPCECL